MKNRSMCYTLLLSCSLASFMPSEAMQSFRQRIHPLKQKFAQKMPNWAKGAGFQAAKKKHWGRQPLTAQEQKDYKALMTAVGIGAILAALAAARLAAPYVEKAAAPYIKAIRFPKADAEALVQSYKFDDHQTILRAKANLIDKEIQQQISTVIMSELFGASHEGVLKRVQELYNQLTEYDKILLPYAMFDFQRDIFLEATNPTYRTEKREQEKAEYEDVEKASKLFDNMSESDKAGDIEYLLFDYNSNPTNELKNKILDLYDSLSEKDKQLLKEAVTILNKYRYKKVSIQELFDK